MTPEQPRKKKRKKNCADCPELITRTATRCKPCAMRVVGRRPDKAARFVAIVRANMENPAHVERLRKNIKIAIAKRCENALSWCPPAHRDEWREWSRTAENRRKPMEQRRTAFLALIKAKRAAMSPFERQEMALANSARLVANRAIYGSAR